MQRHVGSVRCAVAARMSTSPVVFLLLFAGLALTTAAPTHNTTTPRVREAKRTSTKHISSIDQHAILVMSITFPSAFIVGILWCYCMTSVCGIRSGSKSSLTTERVPPSNQILSVTSRGSSDSSLS
ncbi:hypothetical protein LSAT2_019551 [Lamellibrachia satsuma]|nr:hypothetical protein LSAT2_019551 [Lamellibrachia satsuma]